jgi:hypothetical protein
VDQRVESFRSAAEAYCRTLESAETVPEFARRARNAAAKVYLAAAFLPKGDAGAEAVSRPPVRQRETADLERGVAAALGREAYTVSDAFDAEPRAPTMGSLSLELGEIYDDLGRALALLERGGADDLRQVRCDFEEHWGRHAVEVLRPLHHLANGR